MKNNFTCVLSCPYDTLCRFLTNKTARCLKMKSRNSKRLFCVWTLLPRLYHLSVCVVKHSDPQITRGRRR